MYSAVIDTYSVPHQYTQVPKCDTYFVSTEKFQEHLKRYTQEYPQLERLFSELETVQATQRAEFHALLELGIGFLRSVDINDSERWEVVSRQRWNYQVLTHTRVPQEYYATLLEVANAIRNKYFEQPPISDWLISREQQKYHVSMRELLFERPHLDVCESFARTSLVRHGVLELLEKNPWKRWQKNPESPEKLQVDSTIADILRHVLVVLSIDPKDPAAQRIIRMIDGDDTPPCEPGNAYIRVSTALFLRGLEELVDLSLALVQQNYSEVTRTLKTDNKGLGRLKDPDYTPFFPYYAFLGSIFFMTQQMPSGKHNPKRKSWQQLASVFNQELGISLKSTQEMGANLSHSDTLEAQKFIDQTILR